MQKIVEFQQINIIQIDVKYNPKKYEWDSWSHVPHGAHNSTSKSLT